MISRYKNRKTLLLLTACLLIAALASTTIVTSGSMPWHSIAQKVKGTFTQDSIQVPYFSGNDPNYVGYPYYALLFVQYSTFAGSFVGPWVSHWVIYSNTTDGTYYTIAFGEFKGTVYDAKNAPIGTGTLTFQISAHGGFPATGQWFHDDWVITGGTGGLTKITGFGTADFNYSKDPINTFYSGMIFIGK